MTCGEKIKNLRKNLNLSLREFSKCTGVTHTTISRLENGGDSKGLIKEGIYIDTLKQICIRSHYDFRTFLEETGYIEPAEETQKAQPTMAKPILSDESQLMLEKFNSLSKIQKIAIMNLMDTFVEPQKATIKNNA